MSKNSSSSGVGLGMVIFIVFLILKLIGVEPIASWSYWWIFSPLWIPLAVVLAVLVFLGIIKALLT